MTPRADVPPAPPVPTSGSVDVDRAARDAERLEALIADIGGRLRAVLATMAPAEFDALIATMARRRLRWDQHEDVVPVPEPRLARLPSDP